MSWKEQIVTDFIIRTGDGTTFGGPNSSSGISFAWKNAKYTIGYNFAEFEWINEDGSFIDRRKRKGRKFNFEIWFQGANCISDAASFELSAADPRPWTITHPFYGNILVQPTELSFDNSQYNVSEIKGILCETLARRKGPSSIAIPAQQIASMVLSTNIALYTSANAVMEATLAGQNAPSPQDFSHSLTNFQNFIKSVNKIRTQAMQYISSADKFALGAEAVAQNYINQFAAATAAMVHLATVPATAISTLQSLIMQPAYFIQSAASRARALTNALIACEANVINSGKSLSQVDKEFIQLIEGSIMSALCITAVNPIARDYGSFDDVISMINIIQDSYAQYINDLDSIQTINGGQPNSFIPDHDSIFALDQMVNQTTAQLYQIALGTKQKRTFVLEADSNWIILNHRLYGQDTADANLTALMSQNDVGQNQILQVRKNSIITYYV